MYYGILGMDLHGETLNTLRFASRASKILITAKISRYIDYEKLYDELKKQYDDLLNTEFKELKRTNEKQKEIIDNKDNELAELK